MSTGWSGVPAGVRDWAIAVGMAATLLVTGLSERPSGTGVALLGYTLLAVGGLALVRRRRTPVPVLAVTGLCAVGYQAAGFEVPAVAFLFAVYAAVREGHRTVTVVASVAVLATLPLAALAAGLHDTGEAFAQARGALEIAWLVAAGAAGEALRQAERRADEAERTREATARRRADEERPPRGSDPPDAAGNGPSGHRELGNVLAEGLDADFRAEFVHAPGLFAGPRNRCPVLHTGDLSAVDLLAALVGQRAVPQKGQLTWAGRACRHRLLHQVEGASLDVELPVGVLGNQPCRACGLLSDIFCRRPTVLIHDVTESVTVPCGQPAPRHLLGGVVAIRVDRGLVIGRSHGREFLRQRGNVVRHSQLPGHIDASCSLSATLEEHIGCRDHSGEW